MQASNLNINLNSFMGRNMELKKKSLEKDFCNVFMTMCKYGYVFMRILFTNRCMRI